MVCNYRGGGGNPRMGREVQYLKTLGTENKLSKNCRSHILSSTNCESRWIAVHKLRTRGKLTKTDHLKIVHPHNACSEVIVNNPTVLDIYIVTCMPKGKNFLLCRTDDRCMSCKISLTPHPTKKNKKITPGWGTPHN